MRTAHHPPHARVSWSAGYRILLEGKCPLHRLHSNLDFQMAGHVFFFVPILLKGGLAVHKTVSGYFSAPQSLG